MAQLTAGYTIVEQAKGIAPDGSQMKIAETMALKMSLLQDLVFFPSNDTWSHKSAQQAKLSGGSWRALNEYVTPGIVLTKDQMDVIGILEDFAIYDKEWIDNQPDPRMARLIRAKMYLEGMAQSIGSAFLYGNNAITPKKPHGLLTRLNSLGRFCISAGGSSALTSIMVVDHGEGKVFGVNPKNSGNAAADFLVSQTDMTGPQGIVDDSSGNKLVVYQDNFKFKGGLVVENPEALGRVANIPSGTATTVAFEDKLIELIDRMDLGPNAVIYMNEKLISAARIRQKDKNNVHWTPGTGEGLFGKSVMNFDEVPVKKIDSRILLNAETEVT